MRSKQVLLIQGHPDASAHHLCHALAAAYASGAQESGHMVRSLNVAELDFPLLRSQHAWEDGELPDGLQEVQDTIRWAQLIVLFFPLWLGDMPALLYRWYFRAHSVKSLQRNILGFAGMAPVHETLIGMVGNFKADDGERWLGKLRRLGLKAQ